MPSLRPHHHLAAPVAQATTPVREQPVQHADETGWTEAKQRVWLWVVVTAQVAVFLLDRSRGTQVARRLLGEVRQGILVSNRWSAHNLGNRSWLSCFTGQVVIGTGHATADCSVGGSPAG